MSLLSDIRRLERWLGTDEDTPRHIVIDAGLHYLESWVEWDGDRVGFYVKIPSRDVNAMDYLTPEMRAEIRPADTFCVLYVANNGRDAHLERDRPPWQRSESARRYLTAGRPFEVSHREWGESPLSTAEAKGGGESSSPELMTVLHLEDNGFGESWS